MKSITVLTILLVLAAPVAADPVPYWIPADGATLYFDAGNGSPWTIEPYLSMSLHMQYGEGDTWYDYCFDDEGDVCCSGNTNMEPAVSLSPFYSDFDPPIKVLDYPLTTGKTWQSESTWDPMEGLSRSCTVNGTVIGPRDVIVDGQTLTVIEVTLEYTYSLSYMNGTRTCYLHEQLGDVRNLVSWTGMVPTQPSTWGDVRSLFR